MANDISFQLDTSAAEAILTDLAAPVVKQSADAIANRATSMAGSMTSQPIDITVDQEVGTIRRGKRSIATVRAKGANAHVNYIGHQALTKAKDAGRV